MRWRIALTAGLLFLAVHLHAQSTNEQWQQSLVNIDNDLRAGNFASADRRLTKLSRAIPEKMRSGSQATYTVAVVASFRALANAGLGRLDDAAWYWSVASSLFPKFEGSDLHVYGAAGESVMRLERERPCAAADRSGEGAAPPRITHLVKPKYPEVALENGIAQPVSIQLTVKADGTAECPRVVAGADEPVLVWVLIEAMRQWRFEPATLEGKAVPATFIETIDFKIRYHQFFQ